MLCSSFLKKQKPILCLHFPAWKFNLDDQWRYGGLTLQKKSVCSKILEFDYGGQAFLSIIQTLMWLFTISLRSRINSYKEVL